MKLLLKSALAGAIAMAAVPAQAAVTFTFSQVGNDVVLTGSGSYNLANATLINVANLSGFVNSSSGALAVGPFGPVQLYGLSTNAGSFGTGGFVEGTPDTGQRFGLNAFAQGGYVSVFDGYVSGTALSGTTTFANQTFASLGLTPGSYTYRIPNDSVTVVIPGAVPGAVPEPATWAMMLLGFGAIGFSVRRRRGASLLQAA